MKKIYKVLFLMISIFMVCLVSSCEIALVKEDIEKEVTEKTPPKLRNIAREYNGKTWNEYVNLKEDNDYYGYFENEVYLSEFQKDNASDGLYFQEYNCVYFYAVGGCEKDNIYKKAFTPIIYKDSEGDWRIVKPTDKISKSLSYDYWDSNEDVKLDSKVWVNVSSGIYLEDWYYSDNEDYTKSLEQSEYVKPKAGRNIIIKASYEDFVESKFASVYDFGKTENNQIYEPDSETGLYIIPLNETVHYEVSIKGYEFEADINEYAKKHNGNSWWVVDSSYYFTTNRMASAFVDEEYNSLFPLQDYYILSVDKDGKDTGNTDYIPIVYEVEEGIYSFVFNSDVIDENITYLYYDESMTLKEYSYIDFTGNIYYDDLDVYLLDEMDSSKITDETFYRGNFGINGDQQWYFSTPYDKKNFFDIDKDYYAAIDLDIVDGTDVVVEYYVNNLYEEIELAEYSDGYYWIKLNGNYKYTIRITTTYDEADLDTIKADLDGYTWSLVRGIDSYYSSTADFAMLIGDYPYFENSKYEMNFIPIWFDSEASGEYYRNTFNPVMFKKDGVYDWVREDDVIDKDTEYIYLSDVIEELFDCSEFYLEWDQVVYTVEVKFIDNLNFDALISYSGIHVKAKSGRMIALKIYSDDEASKYLDLKITYKEKEVTYLNGYFLIEYTGDSRCLFDCNIYYNGLLDSSTVNLNDTIKEYSGYVFDYLYGEETKEDKDIPSFKYSSLADLYNMYSEYIDYMDNTDEVLWWYNNESNNYAPVVEYSDDDSFEFVKAEDKIKENSKYDFWDKDKEAKNKEKKAKKNFKLEVNNPENLEIKAYLMDNYNYYDLYDYNFNRNIKVGQQLVIYADPTIDVSITYNDKELERTEYYGFYVFSFDSVFDYTLNIKSV